MLQFIKAHEIDEYILFFNCLLLASISGQETTFTMKFRAANDYPVDLYFLYDVSISMVDAIKNLGKLADDIGKSKKIWKSFEFICQIVNGSFILIKKKEKAQD